MPSNNLQYESCFPEKNGSDSLPQPLSHHQILTLLNKYTDRVILLISSHFPIGGSEDKVQRNRVRVQKFRDELIQKLRLQEQESSFTTFGHLRQAAKITHGLIRESKKPANQRFPDRKMSNDVGNDVTDAFDAACNDVRTLVKNMLEKQKGPENIAAQKMAVLLAHIPRNAFSLLPNAHNGTLVGNNETISQEDAELFSFFFLVLDQAMGEFVAKKTATLQESILVSVKDATGSDTATQELLNKWTERLFPDPILLEHLEEKADLHSAPITLHETNGGFHTDSDALLIPGKSSHVRLRQNEENGELWPMTEEEKTAFIDVWTKQKAAQPFKKSLNDPTFLQKAAQQVNIRCNGNLNLLRGDREIQMFLSQIEEEPNIVPMIKFVEENGENEPIIAPVAELCNRVLRATENIVNTKVSKGDQAVRVLAKLLFDHLKGRREDLWNSPENTTAFDEFAIEFLQIISGENGDALITANPQAKSIVFNKDFKVHLQGADAILDSLLKHLPPTPIASWDPVEAPEMMKSLTSYIDANGLIALATKFSSDVLPEAETNKYISQALLLKIYKIFENTTFSLREAEKDSLELPGLFLVLLMDFCKMCADVYTINDDTNELTSYIPAKDYTPAVEKFLRGLQILLVRNGKRTLPVHSVKAPPVAPSVKDNIDTEVLLQELQRRKITIIERLSSLGEVRKLQITLDEVCSFRNLLRALDAMSKDDIELQEWLKEMDHSVHELKTLFPKGVEPEEPTTKTSINFTKIEGEVNRLGTLVKTLIRKGNGGSVEKVNLEKQLLRITSEENSLRTIGNLQHQLSETIKEFLNVSSEKIH